MSPCDPTGVSISTSVILAAALGAGSSGTPPVATATSHIRFIVGAACDRYWERSTVLLPLAERPIIPTGSCLSLPSDPVRVRACHGPVRCEGRSSSLRCRRRQRSGLGRRGPRDQPPEPALASVVSITEARTAKPLPPLTHERMAALARDRLRRLTAARGAPATKTTAVAAEQPEQPELPLWWEIHGPSGLVELHAELTVGEVLRRGERPAKIDANLEPWSGKRCASTTSTNCRRLGCCCGRRRTGWRLTTCWTWSLPRSTGWDGRTCGHGICSRSFSATTGIPGGDRRRHHEPVPQELGDDSEGGQRRSAGLERAPGSQADS